MGVTQARRNSRIKQGSVQAVGAAFGKRSVLLEVPRGFSASR